jgi:toxic protein SymE
VEREKKFHTPKIRHLKVYYKYFDKYTPTRTYSFPEIRLSGKWLLELGFEPGDNITLEVKEGKIVICRQ